MIIQSTRSIVITLLSVSLLAIIFLVWLIYFKAEGETGLPFVENLSIVNALLNGSSAIFIILGIRSIQRGQKKKHQKFMLMALLLSSLFLVSYIVYHHFHGDTKFLGQGLIRPIYFFILISHIVLSIIALPIVLITFAFALLSKFTLHRRIARYTFPIWLYVSVTGVLVYLILNHFPASEELTNLIEITTESQFKRNIK